MPFKVVIPSRFGSSRLPGKPLLEIAGKPMVQRVWEQAQRSAADEIIIATDDQRIFDAAGEFGAQACITSHLHPSGTDRLEEVASKMGWSSDTIIVNVQGDEPLIPPAVINQVASNLAAGPECGMATLVEPITCAEDLRNPAIVKAVVNGNSHAMYFSRAPVPWPRDSFTQQQERLPDGGTWWRHIGIYAYRAEFLRQFVGWQPAEAEKLEQLEQLRALANGVLIHVAEAAEEVPPGVDTAQDLAHIQQLMAER